MVRKDTEADGEISCMKISTIQAPRYFLLPLLPSLENVSEK